MEAYTTKSPVLFVIFNRPQSTQAVFDGIRAAKPKRLYVAADGPRADKPEERLLCEQTRSIIEQVDWDCAVFTLFQESNLGCKDAVSSAIDWLFSNETQGIILEDDCLPNQDFFYFCDTMLEKYKDDTRIRHIGGSNLQFGKVWGQASYYFSSLTHVWGWASWKRVWKDYDKDLKQYSEELAKAKLSAIFGEPLIVQTWLRIFNELKQGKITTWDYQYALINMLNDGLSVIPNANLISNIGFNQQATHTFDGDNPYADIPLQTLTEPIVFATVVAATKQADYDTLYRDFALGSRLEQMRKDKTLRRRIKRFLKNIFK